MAITETLTIEESEVITMGLFGIVFGANGKLDGQTKDKTTKAKDLKDAILEDKKPISAKDALVSTMNAALAYNTAEIEDEPAYKSDIMSKTTKFTKEIDDKIQQGIQRQCASRRGTLRISLEYDKRQGSTSYVTASDMGTQNTSVSVTVGRVIPDGVFSSLFHAKDEDGVVLPTNKHRHLYLEAVREDIISRYKALGYEITEREPYRPKPMSFTLSNGQTITESEDDISSSYKLTEITLDWRDGETERFDEKLSEICEPAQVEAVEDGVPFSDAMA